MKLLSSAPFFHPSLPVRHYQLENGLELLALRDASAPLIALQTWFRVGSRNEREGKTGMAHLFEHLMFNQTEHLAPGEFDRKLEAIGADSNAATWLDWTHYRESFPRAHLDLVLSLEADRMAHLVVHDPQVASEKEVVANERRLRVDDDVEGFLEEELYRLAYAVHPYRWPTIGWMRDILAFTTDDARTFYRTYYAPNNATLVMVGDLDPEAACARIEERYGALERSHLPAEERVVEPPIGAPRRAVFDKAVQADRLLAGWRGVGLADHAHAAIEVLVDLLAGGNSSRLHRTLVQERELAASVHANAPEFRDPGLIELRVAMARGRPAEEAEALIDEEAARIADEGPSAVELDRAKARLEARMWRGLRPQDGKAEALGHWHTTVGDYRGLFAAAERVRAVDVEAVRRAAARIAPSRRVTVIARAPRGRSGR
jgi:zinc protease